MFPIVLLMSRKLKSSLSVILAPSHVGALSLPGEVPMSLLNPRAFCPMGFCLSSLTLSARSSGMFSK